MNFWHIQLHPNDKEAFPREKIRNILESKKCIGVGEWPEGQDVISQFKNDLVKGDIVLVRSEGPLALVRIKGDSEFESNPDKDFDWFENRRDVDILSFFEDRIKEQIGKTVDAIFNTKTFARANNSKFIQSWYYMIMKEKEITQIIELLKHKHQIILQGPPGTGKTFTAEDIAYQLIFGEPIDTSKERTEQIEKLSKSDQYKFIQFHPAYSYEDFVRGITAKSNGTSIEYKTENKHLAEFAKKANENFINSKKDVAEISKEKQVEEKFQDFIDSVQDSLDKDGKYFISEQAYIFQIDEDAFRYKGDNWATNHRMPFSEILKLYNFGISGRKEIKEQSNIRGGAKQHATYYFNLLQNFKNYLNTSDNNTLQQQNFDKILPENYVLIIDEINRANLPSVLGELIFALEYREQSVESMYDIDGDRKIVLPKNLYIIGTMNTADRSVGHIDYAIRRRFAFETIFPQRSVINSSEGQILFDKVADLFCKNYDENKKLENERSDFLSGDFLFQDVMIGHSYFMGDEKNLKMKLQYEIKPILREYLKDGIFNLEVTDSNDSTKTINTKDKIEGLNV